MQPLREHERLALSMLLAGNDDVLAVLRSQASQVAVSNRTYSTAGEYVDLILPQGVETVSPSDFILQDIELQFEGVADGAAILLYVRDGRLSLLEFATYGVDWPASPVVLGGHYLREVETQPGTFALEPVVLRDQATLNRALRERRPMGAA